jgi:hypothetical protein
MGDCRYKSDSEAKSLICNNFMLCFFCGHSKKSLDFQGFGRAIERISTKLSTETLNLLQNPSGSST